MFYFKVHFKSLCFNNIYLIRLINYTYLDVLTNILKHMWSTWLYFDYSVSEYILNVQNDNFIITNV